MSRFAVYYGTDTSIWRRVARFQTVALAVEVWPRRRLRALRDRGTRVLAYLSMGESPPPLEPHVPPGVVLGHRLPWRSAFLDVEREPARAWVLESAAASWSRGIDGFLMDTVDVVDVFPRLAAPMASLVRGVRRAHPSAYLLMNRGLGLLPRLADVVDGVLLENCASRDFGPEDRAWVESACRRIRSFGLDGYVLDYATLADPAGSADLAERHGFAHYLAPDPRLDAIIA